MTSTNTEQTRVLVAARLSRIADPSEASRIERDEEAGRQWADANGATVVEVTRDRGVSGSVSPFKRAGLGPWLTDPDLITQYDVIVASSIDRLGRSARDLDTLKAWAEDNGKRLVVLSPDLEWPLPSGSAGSVQRILWSLLGDLAEIERETIRGRIADGVGQARANGSFVGKPGFGFEAVGTKYGKTLRPAPALEPVLRQMIALALDGKGFAEIARHLTATGVPPPQAGKGVKGGKVASGAWSSVSVAQILRSTDLKGRRTESGRTHRFESLLTVAAWNELQAALPKGQRAPIIAETPFLTGVLVCEACGGPMSGRQSTKRRADGTTNVVRYYRCRGPEQAPSRCRNGVSQDDIEQWVDAWFTEDGAFARTEIIETTEVPGDDHRAEVEEIDDEIRALNPDAVDWLEQVQALRAERARLLSLPSEPSQVIERGTGRTVGETWSTLTDEQRRAYLLAAGVQVHVLSNAALRAQPGAENRYITGDPHKVIGTLQGIVEAA